MRMTRAMMLEVFRQDYVRTAEAKGLAPGRVVMIHALRNAMIPSLTIVGVQVAQAIGGSVVMETLFQLPGMGEPPHRGGGAPRLRAVPVARALPGALRHGGEPRRRSRLRRRRSPPPERRAVTAVPSAFALVGELIRKKPLGAACGAAALGLVLVALLADWIAPYPFNQTWLLRASVAERRASLGTDELGRDVLSRVIYGARVSMLVGVAATALAVALGAAMGIAGGFWSGWLNIGLGRVVDAWMAFPGLVMAIVLLALLGPGLWSVILALGISQAFPNSRTIRGATLVVREQPYIEASLAAGASKLRVLLRHVLPNVVAPIIIVASNLPAW